MFKYNFNYPQKGIIQIQLQYNQCFIIFSGELCGKFSLHAGIVRVKRASTKSF